MSDTPLLSRGWKGGCPEWAGGAGGAQRSQHSSGHSQPEGARVPGTCLKQRYQSPHKAEREAKRKRKTNRGSNAFPPNPCSQPVRAERGNGRLACGHRETPQLEAGQLCGAKPQTAPHSTHPLTLIANHTSRPSHAPPSPPPQCPPTPTHAIQRASFRPGTLEPGVALLGKSVSFTPSFTLIPRRNPESGCLCNQRSRRAPPPRLPRPHPPPISSTPGLPLSTAGLQNTHRFHRPPRPPVMRQEKTR